MLSRTQMATVKEGLGVIPHGRLSLPEPVFFFLHALKRNRVSLPPCIAKK